jgi:EmrB/QacA subfamily drug resistance transporter
MSSHHTDTRRQGFALALICIAQFMVVLDFSIVNIALPFMQKDLGLSTANLQWIVSAYALTFGGFLLLGGRMGDLYGRRKLFMAGLFVFSLASLSGGLALSGTMLIVSRAIQGVGAAMVAPTAIALVSTTFPEGPARNKAFGMVGAISSLGFAAGAIFGGLLTAGPGWRWVMFVNVPIGLVTLVLIPRLLTESQNQNKQRRVDVLGAILVTAGLIALVYTLSQGNSSGWLSLQTIGLFVLSVVLLVAFVIVEQRSSSPLVRLGIFRLRNVTGANLINLITPGVMGSVIFVLTLFMQEVMARPCDLRFWSLAWAWASPSQPS